MRKSSILSVFIFAAIVSCNNSTSNNSNAKSGKNGLASAMDSMRTNDKIADWSLSSNQETLNVYVIDNDWNTYTKTQQEDLARNILKIYVSSIPTGLQVEISSANDSAKLAEDRSVNIKNNLSPQIFKK